MIKMRRFLAFVLAFAMVLSAVPGGYASQLPDEEEEITSIEVAEDLAEEEIPEETEAVTATEEEPDLLPYDLPGMPEGFFLTQEDYARKEKLAAHHTAASLEKLHEGKDYEAGVILYSADSYDAALMIADAYDAELISFDWGMAKAELRSISVVEAVRLAEDLSVPLPAVNANAYFPVEPNHPVGGNSPIAPQSLELPASTTWDTWVNELMKDPDEFLIDPASPEFQWYHDTLHTYEAWGVTTGNPAIKVGIIDTGVSSANVDLRHVLHLDIGRGEGDAHGHGTHVAGIIGAAMDNGWYGAGIAPNVSVYSIRTVSSAGTFSYEDTVKAINCAVEEGICLINMSLGGPVYNQVMEEALYQAYAHGVTVVAACGNDGTNLINYPAAYETVISVAATDTLDQRAYFSNYGSTVDIAAPGVGILSTYLDGIHMLNGTSMACPMVTGAAALYMSKMYETSGRIPSPAEVKAALKSAVNPSASSGIGAGVLDISKLFSGVKTAPVITVLDEYGTAAAGSVKTVTVDGSVEISQPDSNDALLIYTLDGKTPAVKSGTVAIGEEYTAPISLTDLAPGSYTLKAASVSAMGVLSKIAKVTLKVLPSSHPQAIRVMAPKSMIAGKTVQLAAQVLPENAIQDVRWELIENPIGASLDARGNLKTLAGKFGIVKVRAVSRDTESCTSEILSIEINPGTSAASVTLNTTEAVLRTYRSGSQSVILQPTAVDASGSPLDPETVTFRFTSSNPKVASVTQDGTVTAIGAGTATITCKVLDGSGKSAVCKVTVKSGLENAAISGQLGIAPGSSAAYKVTMEPASVPGVSTRWYLEDAPDGVSISGKGTVKVSSKAEIGDGFTVAAEISDGTVTRRAEQYVEVCPKTKAVHIYLAGNEVPFEVKESKAGWLTGATLHSNDLFAQYADGALYCSNTLQLGADIGDSWIPPAWSSSAPEIAEVDEDGYVTAHKAGTAKITCQAQDGSGKSASVTINVITPASSVQVESSAARVGSDRFIAYGKSVQNTAVLGKTYGSPSVQKVTWAIASAQVRNYDNIMEDYTEFLLREKKISITSGGKLSVKKDAYFWIPGTLYITVQATTLDGTDQTAQLRYIVDLPATWIGLEYGTRSIDLTVNDPMAPYYAIESDIAYQLYTVKSSNPAIAGASLELIGGRYFVFFSAGQKAGTAKITVSTADGSKKSTVITVRVRK